MKGANPLAVRFGIKNFKQLNSEIEKLKKAPQTVLDRTLADVKTRVPGWVSTEVAKEYGIKKKEVGDGKTSSLRIVGNKMPNVRLEYSGRMLTPAHFSMSPKAPKEDRGAYTLKATIVKGERKAIGHVKKLTKKQRKDMAKNFRKEGTRNSPQSPWMLQTTGAKSPDKVAYIPFQRQKQPGKFDHVFRTVSVPQMIDNKAAPGIQKAIDEGLSKRLDHHMKILQK